MTLTLPWQATISRARHAGQTPTQLKDQIAKLLADNRMLIGETSDLNCAVHKALMNSLRDEMRIAQAERERDAAVAEVRRLQSKVIRAGAEQERLRQAVIQARPRITEVPCELVRPYSPDVVLPYVSPVPYRDTSNETTQTLPLLDVPQEVA
ncbi:hypothetical protein OG432_24675 [Streptomyces sp. NBC_00442]|uniref:hypothetical protein n=1 Tax=Streptomyces sp. NBC_00442 TaxID=2903651 RepID=UPI002E24C030